MGSFVNVIAHRAIIKRKWWGSERSICETCGHVLTVSELIPIVSWFIQKGKCRNCGVRLSVRYLLVEVIGAIGGASLALRWGLSWAFVLSFVTFFGILLNSLTDYESGDVFDLFTLALLALGFLTRLIGGRDAILSGIAGAVIGWGIFATLIALSRGGMGWGDAAFMKGVGAVLGWNLTVLAFYFGIMAGGIGAIILLIRGKVKWGRRDSIPLIPYLAFGSWITLLWGPQILQYLDLYFDMPRAFMVQWPFF